MRNYLLKESKIILSVLLILAVNVFGQEFKLTVDRTTVGQNEQFEVNFEFSASDNSGLKNFNPPSFRGFKTLRGPSQSTSMQIINGRTTSSITLSYVLIAPETGKYTIEPGSIEYKGNVYKSNSLDIEVVKGTAPQTQQKNQDETSNADIAENLQLVAQVDKNSVYKGEQITVTYKLLTRLDIDSPQITKLPTYKGFWAEDLDAIKTINFTPEMYKGQRFNSAVLKKVALFPTQSGKLSITPFELTIPVKIQRKRRSNDIFDQFFNDSFFGSRQSVQFEAKSNAVDVTVKELPENGKPVSFNGAVGNFKLSSKLSKTDVETNESITLTIAITGSGNVKLLEVPKVTLPVGFEQYEPKTSENLDKSAKISGTKTVEYLIVPRIPGVKEIPSVEFAYFNPADQKYITVTTPPYKVNIKKGENTIEPALSGFSKEDVKLLNEDIRYIKTSNYNLQKFEHGRLIQSWFWISIVLPIIGFVAFLSFKKRQDKLSGNLQLVKYQKAEKNARSRLKAAKKALESNDTGKYHNEISNALYGYLEDKLAMQKADFTQDKALAELKLRGVDENLTDRVNKILDKCEFIRFAPHMSNMEESNLLFEDTVKVIVDLENSILIRKNK